MSAETSPAAELAGDAALRRDAHRAVRAGCEHLAARQTDDGCWRGDYGGPMFLLPMYVAVARFAGHEIAADRRHEMLRSLRHAQNDDGSVGVYESGAGCLFTTSLVYVALRLLGASADDDALRRMALWVRSNGTPLRCAPWGRFTLALIDLYDYEGLDPISPELWLLPYAIPFHPGRMWCHARQVYLPMAYLYARRARRPADALVRAIRGELYDGDYARIDWARHRGVTAATDTYRPSSPWLRAANFALGAWERVVPARLRARAIDETFRHIAYEDAVTDFIRIGPVNAVLNTACHAAREPDGAELHKSFAALEQYLWAGEHGLSMQGYNSSALWDTTFAAQSIMAAPCAGDFGATLARAHGYVRDNQIVADVPEAAGHYRERSRGGWPFSNRAHGWPITDCTAEGFKCALALSKHADAPVDDELLFASVELMLSLQNADGGWATYERQRAGAWLEALNPSQIFGDIMVDYSFTECTGAVLQALAVAPARFAARFAPRIDRAIARGARFLSDRQRADGAWEGSWGVCFTYGTWFGVSGLLAAGVAHDDPRIERACAFLLAHQKPDGSWGERPESCSERRYVEHADGQVVMSSWALSTLVRARHRDHDAMGRAARFLIERQRADGGWARESMAGVFNRTCMINYDNYRLYFPVWALGEWLALNA